MTKLQKLNTLKTLLADMVHINMENLKRKEIIAAAVRNGLVEKDTYVALKASAKSSSKGYYVVAEMLKLVESKLAKGTPVAKAKKATKKVAVKRSIEQEIAEEVRGTEDEIGDVSCFSEFENSYNEMALESELSIMGTSL